MIKRKKTRELFIGKIGVGGDHPVSVQSMTNTKTSDPKATLAQIETLAAAGCEIVRLGIPDEKAARALKAIRAGTELPLVADIHFDHKLALIAIEAGIDALRINPGNIGKKSHVEAVAKAASERKIPIRVGVNAGSLDKDILQKHGHPTPAAMVESARKHIRILEDLNFHAIKVSLKASDVPTTVAAYRLMAKEGDYPLHLGITEAGTSFSGTIASSIGLGILLAEGIGDTIRVSLTAPPEEEARVGWEILKSLGIRNRGIKFVSCPTCARAEFDVVTVAAGIEKRLSNVSQSMTVAVMGCVVNGPGEARMADVGLAGAKDGELSLYIKGKLAKRIHAANALDELDHAVSEYLAESALK